MDCSKIIKILISAITALTGAIIYLYIHIDSRLIAERKNCEQERMRNNEIMDRLLEEQSNTIKKLKQGENN